MTINDLPFIGAAPGMRNLMLATGPALCAPERGI